MDDLLEAEEKRAVLRRVAAYRDVQKAVRKGSTSSLFFGAFMLAIWYFLFGQREDFGAFSLIYLGLAALELSVGLWNRFAPSAEGVFFDGLVLLLFGGATLLRQLLIVQGVLPGRPFGFSILLGLWWLWQGWGHIRTYGSLRRAFEQRPTGEHLRWFDELIREIQQGDPEADDDLLELPLNTPARAKLLGDTAIILFAQSSDVVIIGRDQFHIDPGANRGTEGLPTATFSIGLHEIGEFTLQPETWRNYTRWKAEGGTPVTGT